MVGDQRNTPTGRVLEGVNKFTYWCHSFEAIDNIGPNELFEHIFEKLLPNMRFFETLVSTGGKSEIYFTIHGHENGGDTLKWAVLEYFVKLKINLSVELFP